LAPVLHALVLDPLVVTDGDAAGVADDVGDQLDATLRQYAVAFRRGRSVGALRDQLAPEALCHGAGDLASQRRGNADVGIHVPAVRPGDLLRLRVPAHGAPQVAGIFVDVGDEVDDVDAVGIEDGAPGVVHGQEPRTEAAEDLRGVRPDVPEPLQDEGAA